MKRLQTVVNEKFNEQESTYRNTCISKNVDGVQFSSKFRIITPNSENFSIKDFTYYCSQRVLEILVL